MLTMPPHELVDEQPTRRPVINAIDELVVDELIDDLVDENAMKQGLC